MTHRSLGPDPLALSAAAFDDERTELYQARDDVAAQATKIHQLSDELTYWKRSAGRSTQLLLDFLIEMTADTEQLYCNDSDFCPGLKSSVRYPMKRCGLHARYWSIRRHMERRGLWPMGSAQPGTGETEYPRGGGQ